MAWATWPSKIARAMGAEVTFSPTPRKKLAEAAKLGATGVLEGDKDTLKALKRSFDFLLDTIPQKHEIDLYINLLKRDRTLVIVGALEPLKAVNNQTRAMHRTSTAGSIIGNLAETQEVLDFCAAHNIGPEVQVIPIQQVNDAYKDVIDGDVRLSLRHRLGDSETRRGNLSERRRNLNDKAASV